MIYPCLSYDLFVLKQRILRRVSVIVGRLGAEFTVLRAAAAFPVDDRADVKLILAKPSANLIRALAQLLQRLLIQAQRFFFGDLSAI